MRIERRLVFDDWVYGSARTSFVHDDFFGRFSSIWNRCRSTRAMAPTGVAHG